MINFHEKKWLSVRRILFDTKITMSKAAFFNEIWPQERKWFHITTKINYQQTIFRKTNISYPLIRRRTCAYRGLEILVFRNIIRTN